MNAVSRVVENFYFLSKFVLQYNAAKNFLRYDQLFIDHLPHMKGLLKTTLVWISIYLILSPLLLIKPSIAETLQNIEVCFIALDINNQIKQNLPSDTNVQIDFYDNVHLQENTINTLSGNFATVSYTQASPANRDLIGNDGIYDGYCETRQFTVDATTEYAYTQARIFSPNDISVVGYNDQFDIQVQSIADVFTYSNEFFDDIIGNESARNINSDGHIIMDVNREYRHLITILKDNTPIITNQPPQIYLSLNGEAEYTNNAVVQTDLNIATTNVIQNIRFGPSEVSIASLNWANYSDFNGEYILPGSDSTGNKRLCIQVKDSLNQDSNIACDEIIFDNLPPIGSIFINNDEIETSNTNLNLSLNAIDPILEDDQNGIGGIQMRFSEDNSNWSVWEPYLATKTFQTTTNNGQAFVFVQFQDSLGNVSISYSDNILVDPNSTIGTLRINNDDAYTNTSLVNLTLNKIGNRTPLYVRFIQTSNGQVPSNPPNVYNPTDNLGGWTYWQNYSENKQWDHDHPEAGTGTDGYGKKSIYAQYMWSDNTVTEIFRDSIIYAPYYAIEYRSVDHSELITEPQNSTPDFSYEPFFPEYTLNNIPTSLNTQEEVIIKLNTKNNGTFSWQPNIVNITNFWEVINIAPEFQSLVQSSTRGNNATPASIINYNQETGTLSLTVKAPSYPGTYKLKLDAIHEGVAQFSQFNNPSPGFEITVTTNPNTPQPGSDEEPDTDFTGYYPSNPYSGQLHVITGYVRYAPPNQYNAPYMIVEADGSSAYWYINQYDIGQYLNQVISVPIVIDNPSILSYYVIGWDAIPISYPSSLTLRPGDTIPIEIRYQNAGYHIWPIGTTRLGVTQSANGTSLFYDGSWLSDGRINMANNNQVRYGDVASFRFNIHAPTNIAVGSYRQCFEPLVEMVTWIGGSGRDVCINITVTNQPTPPVNNIPPISPTPSGDTGYVVRYACLDVLAGPQAGFPVVVHINYGDAVTVIGEATVGATDWLQIRTGSGVEGWVPRSSIDHVNDPANISFNLNNTYIASYVCGSSLTVYSGPGAEYGVKQILPQWTSTYILTSYNGWQLITMPNNTTGWVNSRSQLCAGSPQVLGYSTNNGNYSGQTIYNGELISRPLNQGSYIVTQYFNSRHNGVDYAASCGTPVFSIAEGIVMIAQSGFSNTYNPNLTGAARIEAMNRVNYVMIAHKNGIMSIYAHLQDVNVTLGQHVQMGQKIGTVGNTGWSTGCHLHFSTRTPSGAYLDPESILSQQVNVDQLRAFNSVRSRENNSTSYLAVNNPNGVTHQYCGAWIKDYEYFLEPGETWRTYTNLIYNPSINKSLRLRGDIRLAYWNKYGGTCGNLGLPTTDDLWAAQYISNGTTTTGAYQKFDKGTIHSSGHGTYATTGTLDYIHTSGGGTGRYGFPLGEMYNTTERGMCQQFESGLLCERDAPDNRSDAEKAIDARAKALGSTGPSALINICGYPAKTYSNVITGEDGAIVYVNGKATYSYGGTYDTFDYFSDRCTRFGIWTNDPAVGGKGPYNTPGAYQDYQNGRIYWSWKHVGKFVFGTIKNRFETAGGTNSQYGWPTSEVYSVNENDVQTNCQNFEGSGVYRRICESTVPEDTPAQKAFYQLTGIRFSPSQIRMECGRETVNLANGVAIYDSNRNLARSITGNIFTAYNSNGGCTTFGIPENNTDSVWGAGNVTGFAQRFIRSGSPQVINDFYEYNNNVTILEGTPRNIFELHNGLGTNGFPVRYFIDSSLEDRGVCVQTTTSGNICERPIPEWSVLLRSRVEGENQTYDLSQISSICSNNDYKIHPLSNGIIYYDPIYHNTRIIRSNIFIYWNRADKGCAVLGLPENDTSFPISPQGTPGEAQRFYRDEKIFDIYWSQFGTIELEGAARNLYNNNGGLWNNGFPKNVFEDSVRGVCVETEDSTICQNEAADPGTCAEGQTWDPVSAQCLENKEYECRQLQMHKFTSSQNQVVCAKTLNISYFNQYLKDDGTYSEPSDGNKMCGAASIVMISSYLGKLPIKDKSTRIKDYMYKDEGQGIINGTQLASITNPYTGQPINICHDGAFGLTGAFVSCSESSKEGMEAYIKLIGLKKDSEIWHNPYDFDPSWNFVKNSIDNGHPVIITYGWKDKLFGHITVIKGYTSDIDGKKFVMNDSFTDTSVHGVENGYNLDGNNALYSLWEKGWEPGYLISVSK